MPRSYRETASAYVLRCGGGGVRAGLAAGFAGVGLAAGPAALTGRAAGLPGLVADFVTGLVAGFAVCLAADFAAGRAAGFAMEFAARLTAGRAFAFLDAPADLAGLAGAGRAALRLVFAIEMLLSRRTRRCCHRSAIGARQKTTGTSLVFLRALVAGPRADNETTVH
jgi:hypothetical protein